MNNIMLGASISSWADTIVNAIESFVGPLLIVLCSVGVIWAIVVGIKMLKADSKDAREENKQRLINIAISIVAVIVLIGIFYGLKAYFETNKDDPTHGTPSDIIGGSSSNS